MEISKGYKQTEIGVIPKDWDVKKLGDLASLRTGPFGSSLHKSDYVRDGIPFINPTHIFGGELFPDRDVTVSVASAKRLSEFQLKTNDIIMGRRGEMGRCAVIKESQQGWLCGSGSLIIKPNSNIVSEFLQRIISSAYVIGKIEEASVGSTMINLNQAVLFGLRIPCPPLPEQHAIAAALSDADSLLSALDSLIAKKRLIKQGAMQDLLTGKRRLSGFSGKWKVKMLKDLANIIMGQSPDSRYYNYESIGVPLIQGNADIQNRLSIQRVWTTQITKSCSKGDLILTVRAPVGAIGIATEDSCVGRGVCALRPVNVDKDFLYHALVFNENAWKALEQGSTFTSANSKQVGEFPISIGVSLAEQAAIAEILSDMDAEITALESRREKTRLLKQGMMSELLTGRIRLV